MILNYYLVLSSLLPALSYVTIRTITPNEFQRNQQISSLANNKLTRFKSSISNKIQSNHHDRMIFNFGLIADIQYVDFPNSMNFQKTKTRRYRQSLEIYKEAVDAWNKIDSISTAIILGDILDGKTAELQSQETCLESFLNITRNINNGGLKLHYCFGNHCHYSFNRSEIIENILFSDTSVLSDFNNINSLNVKYSKIRSYTLSEMSLPNIIKGRESQLYYDWSPCKGWRFVSIDSYDISLMGASSLENKILAHDMIRKNNPNDVSIGSGTWFNGLSREKMRWVPYNGGCSVAQINWFKDILHKSKENNERVIVFCHQPIWSPHKPYSIVWNSEEILQAVHASGNVCLWISGHDHDGSYCCDDAGVHHLIPPAPIECNMGQTAFGNIEVYEDELILRWTGKTPRDNEVPWPVNMKIRI